MHLLHELQALRSNKDELQSGFLNVKSSTQLPIFNNITHTRRQRCFLFTSQTRQENQYATLILTGVQYSIFLVKAQNKINKKVGNFSGYSQMYYYLSCMKLLPHIDVIYLQQVSILNNMFLFLQNINKTHAATKFTNHMYNTIYSVIQQ